MLDQMSEFKSQQELRNRVVSIIKQREIPLKLVVAEVPIARPTLDLFLDGGKVKIVVYSKLEKWCIKFEDKK